MITIHIKVKTKARTSKVEKVDATHYIVWTHAVPEKGKANTDVTKLLAMYFDIAQSRIIITSGLTSKNKTASVDIP